MREWWVYELVAGRWRYIGMTSDVKRRLQFHRGAIAKHSEQPRTENWHQALREYPDPESWQIRVLNGPFETETAAYAEEERLQREDWDNPGRVWEKCGNTHSDEARAKMSAAHTGKKHSDETKDKIKEALSGENNPMYGQVSAMKGKKHSKEARAKLSEANTGKKLSKETRAKMSEAKSGENNPFHGKQHAAEAKAKMKEAWVRRRAEKAASQ